MTYRLPELEIPKDDPFRNDVLERRPIVEFLAGLIERTGGPFVLALDSPWGSGKTTLVRMLEAELRRQDYACVYFNAWQVDYVTDPLVALVSSIAQLEIGNEVAESSFKDHLKTVRRVTSLVAKRTVVAAAKALTVGALDLEEEVEAAVAELAGESVNDIVEAFQKESSLLEKFRAELGSAVGQLPSAGKKPTLVFFVDEIDRCRPTFAIELLERVKHLFDVSNILFVLSLDKRQLEASIAAVYGQGINAPEYLRRFIDLEYAIPVAKTKKFVESLFSRFGLDEIFTKRKHDHSQYDRTHLIDFLSTFADAIPLSLRAQERCLTRLRVVIDQTPSNESLNPVLIALLIALRASATDLFWSLSRGDASPKDVMEYLGGLRGGEKIVAGKSGMRIEALLITADLNRERKDLTISSLQALVNDEKKLDNQRARDLFRMISNIEEQYWGDLKLSQLTRKIDLAAGLRD